MDMRRSKIKVLTSLLQVATTYNILLIAYILENLFQTKLRKQDLQFQWSELYCHRHTLTKGSHQQYTASKKKLRYVRIYIKTRTQLENFSRVAKTMKRMNSSPVFSKLTLSSRSKLFFSVWDCPFTAERMKR